MKIDRAAAFHEAGHSVISKLMPFGSLKGFEPGTAQYKEMVWTMLVSYLAGGIAEELATGDFLHSAARGDAEKAFAVASTLAFWGEDAEELMERGMSEAERLLAQHWGMVQEKAQDYQSRDWPPMHVVVHMCPRGQA